MSWWGKMVGGAFGFMLGGPLGAVLGAALGHSFDKGLEGLPDNLLGADGATGADRERIQTAFFTATFSVMGAVAKADGRVSPEEIDMAGAVMDEMNLQPDMRKAAIRLFGQGKQADFPLDDVLDQFRTECHRRTTLMQMFLELQMQAAYADGHLDAAEHRLLLHIFDKLGFSQRDYEHLERLILGQRHAGGAGGGSAAYTLEDAYGVLGVSKDASDAEVKKAYRRLLSQHHPDKLVAKGLPEEMMKVAAHKTHEVKQAYERIKDARGLK